MRLGVLCCMDMKGLLIDTSTASGLVGLTVEGKLERWERLPFSNQISKYLIPAIEGWVEGLDYIGVGIGPGSYSGTRTGAAVALSLAWGLELPLVSFYSLKLFLPRLDGTMLYVGEPKKEKYYLFDGISAPALAGREEVIERGRKAEKIVTPNPLLLKEHIEQELIEARPSLEQVAPVVYQKFLKEQYDPQRRIELCYLHEI